ncbi:MAG: hypothetical protein JWP57_1685, partial [Spirosoma sp.]|nr:hypothetical protein [Spirosoma sp.]
VLILFGLSWFLRRDEAGHVPSGIALAASFLGFAIAGVTGWLGGELVDRLGVGIDNGAHLNAPNSLSGRPAAGIDGEGGHMTDVRGRERQV